MGVYIDRLGFGGLSMKGGDWEWRSLLSSSVGEKFVHEGKR